MKTFIDIASIFISFEIFKTKEIQIVVVTRN